MCGICGIASLSAVGRHEPSTDHIGRKMTNEIRHRGPDSEGLYIDEGIFLGMRRLSIIDLNTGDQPIFNEDKSLCIIFNGEIYNFRELKPNLIQKGHKFNSTSDTEVIIHLYEELGEKCLDKLRGMFAFAIWDKKEKKLFIARDRLGIKPIYYSHTPKGFLFASELKSILASQYIKKEIDYTAMSDYLTFLYVPAPRTIFRNIYKLLPGHYLTLKDGREEIKQYWDLEFEETSLVKDENEYIEKFLELFEESVKLHLESDVPLGVFLSGGTDSSLVVAMMSRLSNETIETFTVGYEGRDEYFDERKYSRIVANQFETNHHEFTLKPNIQELMEGIVSHFDEPFADASAIPNYLISAETRKYVKVALSGLGGDELCGGYERYLGCVLAERYQKLPSFLRNKIAPALVNKLPDSKKGRHFNERLKRFVNCANYPFLRRYFEIVATFNEEEKRELFVPEVQNQIERQSDMFFYDYSKSTDNLCPINTMSKIDLKTYLVDDLLTVTDRMSMAHSLEARVPFIDHKLVEFFATIPPSLKIRGFSKKYLLKRAAERLLPREVIYRKKMGFSVPLVNWFRSEIREYVNDTLSESRIEQLDCFNPVFISKIKESHLGLKSNFDEKLWALISFVKWHEKYVDNA
jgi:asparagine synthase (glutamine-hydrolysing)